MKKNYSNTKNLNRIIHKYSYTQYYQIVNYSIKIYYNKSIIGLGDGLNNIIMTYSNSKMFPKPNIICDMIENNKQLRPQTILAKFSNFNNLKTIPYHESFIKSNNQPIFKKILLQKNLKKQLFFEKYIFNYFSKIIQDELYISLLCEINRNTSLSYYNTLPQDIIILIINFLTKLNLFDF